MAEVVTGEAVVLDVPVAGFPVRLLALLVDMAVQIVAIVVFLIILFSAAGGLNGASQAAIFLGGYVLIVVGYPTIFETLTRGKTLGKMAFGLRVVSDDGSPVRFRQALLRALTGLLEIWSTIGAPAGLITSMLSARAKRLGDLAAGTFVISERVPARRPLPPWLAVVPPPLAGWAASLELSRLSDRDAEAAASYLRRLPELRQPARDQLGLQLAAAVAAQVSPPPPPGTPPAAFLAAVLAVRREREFARHAPPPGPGYGPPPGYAAGPVPPQPGYGPGPGYGPQPGYGPGPGPNYPAGPGLTPSPPDAAKPGAPGGFAPPG